MKKKLLLSILLCVCASTVFFSFKEESKNIYIAPVSSISNTNPVNDIFLIGVMNGGGDNGYNRLTNELHTNTWHRYPSYGSSDLGWYTFHNNYTAVDYLTSNIQNYENYVLNVLDGNNSAGMKTLMHRIKIDYLAYGQRSDYEAVSESYYLANDPYGDYWFYTYNTSVDNGASIKDIIDNSTHGSEELVKQCLAGQGISSETLILEGLKSNREQCATFPYSSKYMVDGQFAWHIKPRIRINPSDAFANKRVCRIEIINFEGNTIKNVILMGNKFIYGGNYSGEYIEEYFNLHQDSLLDISDGTLFNPNGGNWEETNPASPDYSQVDFKVYWSGECDMWIDYVRVDNQTAHELFKGDYDNTWLRWEVEDIAMNGGYSDDLFRFYIEEFEFNNRPCMKYVNEKIQEYSNGKYSLMCNPYWGGYNIHKPNVGLHPFTKEEFKRTLIDYVGLKEIFMGSYAFKGYYDQHAHFNGIVYVPNTLPASSYNPNTGRFSQNLSPLQYDDWLQNYFDDPGYNFGHYGEFKFYNELTDYISKEAEIPIYTIVQVHHWNDPNGPIYREPTNEEIKLLTYLPISYGSRGMLYFDFFESGAINPQQFFHRGLTNPDGSSRHENAYEQYSNGQGSKYNTVGSINEKLQKLGPYIMSFDNTNRKTCIYRIPSERNIFHSQTYFSEVVTYKPGTGSPPCIEDDPGDSMSGLIWECANDRYLQVTAFQSSESNTRHFMIVNRRTSPYIESGDYGGRRLVKVKFDANSFSFTGFNNWNVIDLETDQVAATFDKGTSSWIDLGWYLPGEGKLYKISPTLKEGGTLVTDEEVTGVNITCKSMVYGNGHDITINSGTIKFESGAGINMTGGSLICGQWPSEEILLVDLKGKDANTKWQGLELNECRQVKIYKTQFSDITAFRHAVTMTDCFDFNINNNIFSLYNTIKSSSVSADYIFQNEPREILAFYNYNTVTQNTSTIETFRCYSYGSANIPLMMNGNVFDAQSASTAISLFNIGEAVIKNSTITNYGTGIRIFGPASYADLFQNNITSTLADSKGIVVTEGSANLAPDGIYHTGGYNEITNAGSEGTNIELDYGYISANVGENTFNLTDLNLNGFHFTGIFQYETSGEKAAKNCFQFDYDPAYPAHNVINPDSEDPVDFNFDPVTCSPEELQEFEIFSLGGGEVDTVYTESSGGTGGAFSSSFVGILRKGLAFFLVL
jgi:hypothetical protein